MNISQLRADTPGTREVLHFNNAGASLMPNPVFEAVSQYLQAERLHGGYETAAAQHQELQSFYTETAAFIGAKPQEIAFSQSATEAWNLAFYPFISQCSKGDKILTSQAEYASNFLAFLQAKHRFGIEIESIPNDEFGQVDVSALENMVDEKVKLLAITHLPTNGGLVNPAEAIGEIARKYDIPYLLDACQSAGQYPLDVAKIGCDFLSVTGRKYLRAPRGTGFLYMKKKWLERLEPTALDLFSAQWTGPDSYTMRNDARRFENFEYSYAGKVGLAHAIKYARGLGIEAIWDRIQHLSTALRAQLSEISGVTVRDVGKIKSGIVTFHMEQMAAVDLQTKLKEQKINVSLVHPSSTLLDSIERQLPLMIRSSIHYYNTYEEIDRFCQTLKNGSSR